MKPKKKAVYQPGVPKALQEAVSKSVWTLLGPNARESHEQVTRSFLLLYEVGYLAGFVAGEGHGKKTTKR